MKNIGSQMGHKATSGCLLPGMQFEWLRINLQAAVVRLQDSSKDIMFSCRNSVDAMCGKGKESAVTDQIRLLELPPDQCCWLANACNHFSLCLFGFLHVPAAECLTALL